jgi:hypothetical protein
VFATVAEGRLWVVHLRPDELGPDFRETAISAIDPSTGKTLTTFGFGGFASRPRTNRATWP